MRYRVTHHMLLEKMRTFDHGLCVVAFREQRLCEQEDQCPWRHYPLTDGELAELHWTHRGKAYVSKRYYPQYFELTLWDGA
jgi:hypothetical protein